MRDILIIVVKMHIGSQYSCVILDKYYDCKNIVFSYSFL